MNDTIAKLVACLYLYPNYRVDSRGPYGLILDAIEDLDPEVAKRLKEGDLLELYKEAAGVEDIGV